jgi:hypothetical protein
MIVATPMAMRMAMVIVRMAMIVAVILPVR